MDSKKLDPVKIEIFYHRLSELLNEGKEVVRYLSGSTITREAGEVVQGYFLKDGEAVHISCGILVHILNVTRVIEYMTAQGYAEDPGIGINEGDAFINNDPWIGGVHLPDQAMVTPFFYKGKHVGYIASLSHTSEVGAVEAGGMPPSATEAYHDGIHLPAVKLVQGGKMRRDVYNMLLRAVRETKGFELDMKARMAGNERVRRRLTDLVDEVGLDFFEEATHQFVKEVEDICRERLKWFRPGIYRARVFNDTVSPGRHKISTIEVELDFTREGELTVRVPIASPQTKSYNNTHLSALETCVFFTLLVALFHDSRWNTALSRPVKIEIAEGTRISATKDASVAAGVIEILMAFQQALMDALSRAFYVAGKETEVMAGSNTRNTSVWAGVDQFGRNFANVIGSMGYASGGGGRIGRDGIDSSMTYYTPWCFIADTEGEESLAPLFRLMQRQAADSGGFGKWRGGVSIEGIDIVHGSDKVLTYFIGSGGKIPPSQGLFGGYPQCCTFADRIINTDLYDKIRRGEELSYDIAGIRECIKGEYIPGHPSTPSHNSKSGDMLIYRGIAGAGVGDPLERDPELIVKDIRAQVATIDLSEKIYGVVIDPQKLKVDYKATETTRLQRYKERLQKGVPAKQYMSQMIRKRKDRVLPQPSQAWFDETFDFCESFRKQLETEEKLVEDKDETPKVSNIRGVRFKLTPYVNVVETDQGDMMVCSKCGFVYCRAHDNFKYYSLIFEREPEDLYPPERRMLY